MPPSPQCDISDAHTPSVLLVFPRCLDLIGHGNIQRVLAMATYLSRHGVAVDLVYQGGLDVPSREPEFAGFRRIVRVTSSHSAEEDRILSAWEDFYRGYEAPPTALAIGTALTAVVRGLLDAIDYTAVIATYVWTAPMFEGLAHRTLRLADVQDIFSLNASRCEAATGSVSSFSVSEQTERLLWRHWDVLLAITREEADAMAPHRRRTQRILTVPHGVTIMSPTEPDSDVVVYTGSDNASNQAAVTWLLSDVWPRVLAARPQARLRLVGLVCNSIRDTPLASTPNVELIGFVERPAEELANASVCVAPYLYGSGLKIKVIEAAGSGRPVVTTTAGIEGTGFVPGTHLLVEDEAEAFASAIVRLLDDRSLRQRLASSAHASVVRHFSDDACYRPLLDLLCRQAKAPQPGVLPAAIEHRLWRAFKGLGRPPIVVWGNGSHTRRLMASLDRLCIHVRAIVDNRASTTSMSPEGCPVLPGHSFSPAANDLIVLSSEIYETDMWHDLAAARAAGTHVLALYCDELMTDAVKLVFRRAPMSGAESAKR